MRRTVIVVMVILGAATMASAQTIGENFQGGGIVVGGSGYVYSDLESYWSARVSPFMDYLVQDGVTVGAGASVFMDSASTLQISFTPNASFVFGYDPAAETGLAQQVSVNAGVTYYSDADTQFTSVSLTPRYRLMYFLSPRIAAYGELSAVSLQLYETFSLSTYARIAFGLSFHIPNADRVVVNDRPQRSESQRR